MRRKKKRKRNSTQNKAKGTHTLPQRLPVQSIFSAHTLSSGSILATSAWCWAKASWPTAKGNRERCWQGRSRLFILETSAERVSPPLIQTWLFKSWLKFGGMVRIMPPNLPIHTEWLLSIFHNSGQNGILLWMIFLAQMTNVCFINQSPGRNHWDNNVQANNLLSSNVWIIRSGS